MPAKVAINGLGRIGRATLKIVMNTPGLHLVAANRASVVDLWMTQVVDGDLVKVLSWYDNEWGSSSQMVREAGRIAESLS